MCCWVQNAPGKLPCKPKIIPCLLASARHSELRCDRVPDAPAEMPFKPNWFTITGQCMSIW
eukprot:629922-Karenia_brevis.AAC.1